MFNVRKPREALARTLAIARAHAGSKTSIFGFSRGLLRTACDGFSAIALVLGMSSQVAQAIVIDFEALDTTNVSFPPFFVQGDEFYQGGFWMDPFSNAPSAQNGDLVGALVDGAAVGTDCNGNGLLCPTNNPSHFYAALNDGVLALGNLNNLLFTVKSFDAGFIADLSGNPIPAVAGAVRLQGHTPAGPSFTQTFFLPGPDSSGALNFSTFNTTGSFSTRLFDELFVFGFVCDSTGSCSAFTSDQAQFGLDNVNVSVVPEPAPLALMAAGVVAMGALRRRRRSA